MTALPMPHLAGRAEALNALGWTGRDAEWIALVCLHSGTFTRNQFCYRYGCHRHTAQRFVDRLAAKGAAHEHPLPDRATPQRFCHIYARGLYRAVGAEHVRHRRLAGDDVLLRRLLSLDYVIEQPELPWRPTEDEKVAHFAGLGIDRGILPQRLYGRRGNRTKRYFALKLPVAAVGRDATFVYADPGRDTDKEFRTWAAEHGRLWDALRSDGGKVRVVVVARTAAARVHYQRMLAGWIGKPGADPLTSEERRTLDAIDAAIKTRDDAALEQWGGYLEAIKIAGPLGRRFIAASSSGRIDSFSIHLAERLSEVFLPGTAAS